MSFSSLPNLQQSLGFTGGFTGGAGNALANGADFRDAMVSGAWSGLIGAGTSAVLYAGAYGISKAIDTAKAARAIQNKAGNQTPIGSEYTDG